ncbi:hypothetical protein [Gottfriedia solisilvae]|uniref:Uncharacterized protein n=1 Tax=Gottfriedia solisilvae TaxID=1516104 RepID=A0A8J3EXB3_9BACI|nr:hypothetical protein [Gottfriedia solisilvae]GGI11828.1 hypothetical protein GCM10007380_09800 [Gottfriedia solisilvae]
MKVYKAKIQLVFFLIVIGFISLFFTIMFSVSISRFTVSNFFIWIGLIALTYFLFWCSYSLFLSRKKGEGVHWDDEGVVVDFEGNKIFWNEIENIEFHKSENEMLTSSTYIRVFIYKEEQVRLRHKLPFKNIFWRYSGSIDWITIEKPKEMHEALIQFWQEKNKLSSNKNENSFN